MALSDFFAATLLVSLLGVLFFSILARDVLSFPTPWLEEIATLIAVYAVASASIGAWLRNRHIAIEIVPMLFRGKTRRTYDIFLQLFSILFLAAAFYGATEMMARSANNTTTALSISFSYYYCALAVAFGGMLVASILCIIRDLSAEEEKNEENTSGTEEADT